MRNNLWIGSGISGMGEIPSLGNPVKGLTALIRKMFLSGAQGFAYDPNDLTEEKIKWRKNLLLNTEDFVALSSSGFSAVKEITDWLLTALLTAAAGWQLGTLYPIGSVASNVGSGTIIRSIEFKKGTANELRLGGASDGGAVFVDLTTMSVSRNGGNIPYVLTPLSNGWYRLETWHYAQSFATTQLSHMFGWAMSRTSSGLDATGQVGSTLYARNPSFAFVPYETTKSIPYQAISDYTSDFIRQFPLHTLYQDAAGTIPVTAAGQPVGLMLDKSKGLDLGANLVTNGGFDISSGWLTGAGRTVANGVASWDGSSNGSIYQSTTGLVLGDYCEITYTITSITSGALRINLGGNFGIWRTAAGTYTERLCYGSLASVVGVYTSIAGTVASIDNFSARKVLGNHAYQSVSASRPILQQTPILGNELIQDTEFNDSSYWSVSPTVNVSGGFANFVGAATGNNINRANSISLGKTYQLTFTISAISSGSVRPSISLGTGSLLLGDFNKAGTYTVNAVATGTVPAIQLTAIGTINATVDNVSVKEVTGYRTDQNYLAFDGVDDFLQTNNIDFTATDKVSLFAGVRKLNDANSAVLCEVGDGVVSTSFGLLAPSASGANKFDARISPLSSGSKTTDILFNAPVSAVVAMLGARAGGEVAGQLRVNAATQPSVKLVSVAPTFMNAPLYIGRRGGTSLPFNGHLYGLVGIGRLMSDSETKALEKAIAKNTGVTLNV